MEFWMVFSIVMTIGWVATTWIRAKHGYPVEDTFGNLTEHPNPKFGNKEHEEKQDQKLHDLEERVRVLEKIVTDTHKSHELSREIDKLTE